MSVVASVRLAAGPNNLRVSLGVIGRSAGLRVGLCVALATGVGACAGVTARQPSPVEDNVVPAGIVHIRWRTELHAHKLFEPQPEECATGALAGDKLVIGSRGGAIVGVRVADGHIDWATSATGESTVTPALTRPGARSMSARTTARSTRWIPKTAVCVGPIAPKAPSIARPSSEATPSTSRPRPIA